jgi:hypothetical protein
VKYIIFVIDSESNSADGNEMAAIDEFNDMLLEKGHWITAAGIHHGEGAAVLDNRAGAGLVSEGSLYDSAEHYSGFWIIEADSRETALELAAAGSKACNRKVELRAYLR